MGEFIYAPSPCKLPAELETCLRETAQKLWGAEVSVERVDGVPIGRGDDRVAKWAFMSTRPKWAGCDALFACSLLRDGRVEFKLVPWGNEKTYALRSALRARARAMKTNGV